MKDKIKEFFVPKLSPEEEYKQYVDNFRKTHVPEQYNQLKLAYEFNNPEIDHFISISTRTDGKSINYTGFLLKLAIDYEIGLFFLSRNMMLRTSYQDLIDEVIEIYSDIFDRRDFNFVRSQYYVSLNYKDRTIAVIADMNSATELKNFSNYLKKFPIMIYDEFLALETDYLPDEWARLKTIYESIDRVKSYPLIHKPKIVYLGNAVNFDSPVLHGLKIFNILENHPMNTAKIYHYDYHIMLEMHKNENQNKIRNTRAFDSKDDAMTTGRFETNSHNIATDGDRDHVRRNPRFIYIKLKESYLRIWFNKDSLVTILSIESRIDEPYIYNMQLKDNKEHSTYLSEKYFDEEHIKKIDRGAYLFDNNYSKNYITTDFVGLNQLKINKIMREYLRDDDEHKEMESKEKQFQENYLEQTKRGIMQKLWGWWNLRTFKEMLHDRIKYKSITLFFDIETFQYNEAQGKLFPSEYKNMTFSVGVSWVENGKVELEVFPNFKTMFDLIIEVYGGRKKKPRIILNAHNTNKYDNHFLRKDLLYFYPHMRVENYFLMTATTKESNKNSLRLKDLTSKDKKGIILEKRIKSSINLEMVFFLEGIQFETEDNWVKTNSSIKMLGNKLLRLGVVTEDELKTDFDYRKHNLDKDMNDDEARAYAQEIFEKLTDDELTYIKNDVILLAKSVYHYHELFQGFDYSKKTFTSNILESYNTNDLTSFQLLNRIGEGKNKFEVRYTDYQFANQNFYDYLKPFYRGGLNFYNQFYVGKIISDGVFGMDIHSSYPYAMHNFKIPTYIKDYEEHEQPVEIPITYSHDEYSLFQLSKETFDTEILARIDSVILKQILVKYYSTNDFININTYTFRMLENIIGLRFESIPAYSRVTFNTEYFGSREQIEEFYEVKTQGKYKEKLIFNSPYDIQKTDEENKVIYSSEEVDNSKVNLNGLYGIPALRPYFNLFRRDENGGYYNIENGHKNAERNIVFSIFVTSVSLWNLLNPLKYLTQQEIDENFIYCDTDSLYFKVAVKHKLPDSLFTEFSLGTWDMEHEHLENFYVLNHKKYAYEKDGKIKVRAGGVPQDSFNRDMPFEEFIRTQFSDGVEINSTKSIYNKQETISIYPSKTKLEVGKGYRIQTRGKLYDKLKQQMMEDIRSQDDVFTSDVLYVESVLGTFSLSDFFPYTHEVKQKEPLIFLELKQDQIKKIINKLWF